MNREKIQEINPITGRNIPYVMPETQEEKENGKRSVGRNKKSFTPETPFPQNCQILKWQVALLNKNSRTKLLVLQEGVHTFRQEEHFLCNFLQI